MHCLMRLCDWRRGRRTAFLRRVLAGNQGQALVEFALILPMFAVILIGAAEFARLEYAQIEVSSAARAGAEYGAQNTGTAAALTTMQSVAVADAPDVSGISAVASSYCSCSNGGSTSCTSNSCSASAHMLQYVHVNTSASVTPLFHLPFLPRTYTLRGAATMRVEQ